MKRTSWRDHRWAAFGVLIQRRNELILRRSRTQRTAHVRAFSNELLRGRDIVGDTRSGFGATPRTKTMARITPLEVLRLSTDDLPLHERFPFWREVFGQSIVRTDFDTANSRPFRATATLHAFDELGIAVGTTAGLRASRSKALLTDGADDLLILANLSGSCRTSHRDGDLEVGAGEAIMRSSAEVGSTIFPGPNRILNLRIPRRVMAARMAAPEDAMMRRIPANTEALRLLINYVVTTVESPQIAAADLRQLFATHVHDLVAIAIGASRDAIELASGRGLRAARLNAIRADIDAHLSDEQLTVAAIARRHRV